METIKENLVKLDINDLLGCLSEPSIKGKYKGIQTQFKKFVDQTVDTRRKSSTIIAMRDLHNWIKRTMIYVTRSFFKGKCHLLDIAVGRGGDLDKWNKAGITSVFGFDASEESINSIDPFNAGAKQRLSMFNGLDTKVHFEVGNAIRPTTILLNNIESWLKQNNTGSFQIISCQFALHYFFEKESDLKILMGLVNKYLAKGGFFIGTTTNGNAIRSFFKARKSKEVSKNLFTIQIDKFFKKDPYGNKYTFEIKDTSDEGNYFNTMGPSTEFLVDFKELERVAANYNLVPFNKNVFEPYTSAGKTEYPNSSNIILFENLLEFWEPKKGSRSITKDELELNGMYSSFIFQKN
jgi:mRNA (guanine-N7-)-methyltransferase